MRQGWKVSDAKPGTAGRTLVFPYNPYNAEWEGTQYQEKEVTVYDKVDGDDLALLTAIARYGRDVPRTPEAP